MLPKANRVVQAVDFRRIVRRGRRLPTGVAVVHVTEGLAAESRYGFVVSKKVGNAVVRNRIRRRMSEIVRTVGPMETPVDVVVRALPAAASASTSTLKDALTPVLRTS